MEKFIPKKGDTVKILSGGIFITPPEIKVGDVITLTKVNTVKDRYGDLQFEADEFHGYLHQHASWDYYFELVGARENYKIY